MTNKEGAIAPCYVPRAVYYMGFWTPIISFFKWLFGVGLLPGAKVQDFEKRLGERLGTEDLCMPNARFCLHTILSHLNLQKNSKVLMSPINLPDMVSVIENHGLQITFVDFSEQSFEPDLNHVENPESYSLFFHVPLAGIIPDMERISSFCEQHDLILIQDLTQCFGAAYNGRSLIQYSDFSFGSLCDLKVIHTHRGGVLYSSNKSFMEYARNFSKEHLGKIKGSFFLNVIAEDFISSNLLRKNIYRFFSIWIVRVLLSSKNNSVEGITDGSGVKILGFRLFKNFFQSDQVKKGKPFPDFLSYRYCDLQASIGLKRLEKFDEIERKRISRARLFYSLLQGRAREAIPFDWNSQDHVFWKSPLYLKNPEDFKSFCLSHGLDCSQTNLPWLPDRSSVSPNMRRNIVYIPTHWYLSDGEVHKMVAIINDWFKRSG